MRSLLAIGTLALLSLCNCSQTLSTDCSPERNICPDGYRCDAGRCRANIWIPISPGTFLMGSPGAENGHGDDEERHEVTLTHEFVVLATEITQAEFNHVAGYNPSHFTETEWPDALPVESVTWNEAAELCNLLSIEEEYPECYDCVSTEDVTRCELSPEFTSPYDCLGYRLPTEAEWEYVTRANTSDATYGGDIPDGQIGCEGNNQALDSIAWFCGNSAGVPHIVATRESNGFGLYDLLGNIAEWCHDRYGPYEVGTVVDPYGVAAGRERVVRGGSWEDVAVELRAAGRTFVPSETRDPTIGFRPVRTVR